MPTLPPKLQQMAPLTDEELVTRIVDGDSAVFELLMRRHNQRLFRLARSVMRNSDAAEDVVQEAYVRAYANLSRFEGRSSVATWLSRITFHEALRRRRRQQRSRLARGFDLEGLAMSDNRSEGAEPLMQADLRASLTRAMDSLPTAMRAIVMLRLVEELSTRETAESLRMSESNVKVSLHRARELLRDALEQPALPALRDAFSFGEAHCDRMVARVFQRLRKQPDSLAQEEA